MKHTDLSSLTPAKAYTAPEYPTLTDTHDNPAQLKKLPSRWKKNAAVIACIGLLGVSTLAGCFAPESLYNKYGNYKEHYAAYSTYNNIDNKEENGAETEVYNGFTDFDISVRIHGGGDGTPAVYVAYLTEQEALGIIRAQLEAAGLTFGATPPGYRAEEEFWFDFGLDLYDEEKGVAVALVEDRCFGWWCCCYTERITESFAEQTDMPIGIIPNPYEVLSDSRQPAFWWPEDGEEWVYGYDPEQAAAAGTSLYRQLSAQVQAFIELLREQGIL